MTTNALVSHNVLLANVSCAEYELYPEWNFEDESKPVAGKMLLL